MAHYNQDWDDLGRTIQDIVDRAVNSHDYRKLDQTIRQAVGKAVDAGGEAIRRAVDSASRPTVQTVKPKKQPAPVQKPLPVLYGNPSKQTVGGILKIVGGSLMCGVSVAGLLLVEFLFWFDVALGTVPTALALAFLGGGGLLLGSGIRTVGWVNRFKTYRKTLGDKTHCTLERLARSVGKSVRFVRRELRQMITKGLFLEGHLDAEEQSLITSDETYRYYEQSRLQLEQRKLLERQEAQRPKPEPAPKSEIQDILDRGNAFVAEIRRCNDIIPGHEISAKISRMELIVERIFDRAEAHPEVVPDLKKLMDYYLPMTVKLLNAYADMDAQPIQGETIQSSKKEIEDVLDTLNLAFEKLLDDLFEETAMDLSSDISVLQTLLAQEGLTEDELTKMKKQN